MVTVTQIEIDQPAAHPRDSWTQNQALWNLKPLLGICLAVGSVIIMAAIVVLGLIPLYIPTKDVTVYQSDLVPFRLTYGTSQSITSTLTALNIDELKTQLMEKLDLQDITVVFAQLSPSSSSSATGKKRRAVDTAAANQCETSAQLLIIFAIKYPRQCVWKKCQENFLKKVEYKIMTLHAIISLLVKFTNGETLNIVLTYCSLVQTPISIPITTTTTTATTPTPPCPPTNVGSASIIYAAISYPGPTYMCHAYQWTSPTTGLVTLAFQLRHDPNYWSLDDVSVYNGATQLLSNGGFETGSLSPWVVTNPNGMCGPSDTGADTQSPRSGTYALFDGSTGCADQVSQQFSATARQIYVVSFWLQSGQPGDGISALVTLS